MKRYVVKALVGCLGILVLAQAGCGPDPLVAGVMKLTPTNLQKVTFCYKAYQTRNDFAGPKDEADLKSFMCSPRGSEHLRLLGLTESNLDSIFVCERDNQPFKIRYGIEGSPMGVDVPLIFEAVGVDGMRKVSFGNGVIRVATSEECDDWLDGNYEPDEESDFDPRASEANQFGPPDQELDE